MQPENRVAGEALKETLFDHYPAAAGHFFGRLEDQVHRPVPTLVALE